MLDVRSDIFDVPLAVGTILTDREANSYQRTFLFHNKGVDTLTLDIEDSVDGVTWATVDVSFTLAAGVAAIKNVASANILRVRGSGGGDDRDLVITLVNFNLDGNQIWMSPLA